MWKLNTLDAAISPMVRTYTLVNQKWKKMGHRKFKTASDKTEEKIVTWWELLYCQLRLNLKLVKYVNSKRKRHIFAAITCQPLMNSILKSMKSWFNPRPSFNSSKSQVVSLTSSVNVGSVWNSSNISNAWDNIDVQFTVRKVQRPTRNSYRNRETKAQSAKG